MSMSKEDFIDTISTLTYNLVIDTKDRPAKYRDKLERKAITKLAVAFGITDLTEEEYQRILVY